jgi:hypothetical protein
MSDFPAPAGPGPGKPGTLRVERDAGFDAVLDDDHGSLTVRECVFAASDVFYELDPKAYSIALDEWRLEQRDEFLQRVCEQFPHPIAHCVYRFRNSATSERERVGFLCDTWEALIALLFALVLGEARHAAIPLAGTGIQRQWIQSWTIWEHLEVIRLLRDHLPALGTAQLISIQVLDKMLELNQRRNDEVAHRGTLNERQSRDLAEAFEPEVFGILNDLAGLAEVRLVRPERPSGAGKFRCETFAGESTTRRFEQVAVATEARNALLARDRYADEVFAYYDGRMYSLSPMIICRSTARGHRTQLAYFKKKIGGTVGTRLMYEVFGDADPLEDADPARLQELDELKALFVNERRTNQ